MHWTLLQSSWPMLVGLLARVGCILGGGLLGYRGISMITRRPEFRLRLVGFALAGLGVQLSVIGIGSHYRVTHAAASACYANLKQIEGAKATWEIEKKKTSTDQPADDDLFGPEKYVRARPGCPDGGIYTIGTLGLPATCTVHPCKIERGVVLVHGSRRMTLRLNLGWWRYEIDKEEWRPL